jgi:hypothetical protein
VPVRLSIVVTSAVLGLLGAAAPAPAQYPHQVDDFIEVAPFKVHLPAAPPAPLHENSTYGGAITCGRRRIWRLTLSYATRRDRPNVSLFQATRLCRDTPYKRRLRTARVLGSTVSIYYRCGHDGSREICPRRSGVARWARQGRLTLSARMRVSGTWVAFSANNLSVGKLLEVMRSMRPADTNRPSVAFSMFSAAGGTVRCLMSAGQASCLSGGSAITALLSDEPQDIEIWGGLCAMPPPDPRGYRSCTDFRLPARAPTLEDGQRSVADRVVCEATGPSVTCRATAGPLTGRGFRIDSGSAARIG